MLNTEQASVMLGVQAKQVRALIHAKQLTAIDISVNRRRPDYRIAREEVQRFITARTVSVVVKMRNARRYGQKPVKQWVTF